MKICLNQKFDLKRLKMTGKFYVGIKESEELRKIILESSKGIIKSLQNYEEYQLIKNKKEAYIQKLKEDIEEIDRISKKLKDIMPKEEKETKERKKRKRKKNGGYNIKDLNEELSDIEAKISKLDI
jgi:hypothetical protein